MSFSVIQQRADPRALSANITSKSGRVFRWGSDEKGGESVPSGMTITTQTPGGFASMACTLIRRPDLQYYDLDEFAPCTVSGDGGALTAFDGYLSARPMDRGAGYSIAPQAIGYASHMTDDASFSMVYIDRELSKWVGPSTARQIALVGTRNLNQFSAAVSVDQGGNPALSLLGQGTLNNIPDIEVYYDAGANNLINNVLASNIASVGYASPDALNTLAVDSAVSDTGAYVQLTSKTTTDSGTALNAFTLGTRFALITHVYNSAGPAGTAGVNYGWYLENLAVIGNHGLAFQTGPSGIALGPDSGYFGADIVRDIITRAAPLLSTGGIVQDDFVVPHMVFNTPVTADAAVQQVNQYYLNDYGVYENREFFWRPPGTGTRWLLRVGDGVTLQDQGPQIETAFNGVVVQFTDAGGATRFVGPPGYAADATDPSLQDTSSTNPVNAYGRKRWAVVQMTSTSTADGAIAVGAKFLSLTSGRPSQGSAVVTGFGRDSNGRDWPAWMIRAGDTAVFVDTNDQTPRYILSTSYAHDSLKNTLTLDAPPNRMDWIMARLGLSISAID